MQPQYSTQEDVLFQTADGSAWVTPTRFFAHGKTYQLSMLAMVKTDRVPAKRGWAVMATIVGFLLLVGGFQVDATVGVFGLIILGAGILALVLLKDTHRIVFTNASGTDTAAYATKQQEDVFRMHAAINEGMARPRMVAHAPQAQLAPSYPSEPQ